MIVVLNDFALNIARKNVKELFVVSGSDKGVISTCEEQNVHVSEIRLESLSVVLRRVVRVVGYLICSGASKIKLLEIARSYHLDPVEQVLGRGSTYIVSSHHWEHSKVEV